MPSELVIVGTGGMGRETAAWAADTGRKVAGFLDDREELHGTTVAGLPVLGDSGHAVTGDWAVLVAIGATAARDRIAGRLENRAVELARLVHPAAHVGPGVELGPGVIVGPNSVLTRDITADRAAIINFGALIGHDGDLGRAAFVAPGAALAGTVTVGDRATVGIGASVIQGVTVGAEATVGAGAVVIEDVAPGVTVAGVPAAPTET